MRQSLYIIDFMVEGVGDFPFDMLRYDECHPQTSEDVVSIQTTYAAELERLGSEARPVPKRVVKLRKHSRHNIGPTEGRWASFGWRVIEIKD